MLSELSDATILRLVIIAAFALIIAYILFSGRGRKSGKSAAVRVEPVADAVVEAPDGVQPAADAESAYREQPGLDLQPPPPPPASKVGKRKSDEYEKLVMLYLAAKSGHTISGAELVLAAEKVGLIHGHHNIYHRLADASGSGEPVFSMANVIQPGYFDLERIDGLSTPGVSFFLTLPGPVTAVQAWDSMLPIAERMAQLLDAVLLDSERNALGRQRILNIKEELRAYDREKERNTVKPGR